LKLKGKLSKTENKQF